MDESYSESDVSLSPSQILKRLEVLRQLQLLQKEKLQKQRLEYQETSENSSNITEIISHFSNSTSYNTFRSLLQSSQDVSHDAAPRPFELTPNVKECDLVEGVSILNLSRESEFIINSSNSTRSRLSDPLKEKELVTEKIVKDKSLTNQTKNQISLDEMPILSPKKDFEELILEKLQKENNIPKVKVVKDKLLTKQAKPFLRKGEGMARFGLNKKDFKIQNTKSLPWRQKKPTQNINVKKSVINNALKTSKSINKEEAVQILVNEPDSLSLNSSKVQNCNEVQNEQKKTTPTCMKTNMPTNKQTLHILHHNNKNFSILTEPSNKEVLDKFKENSLKSKGKHPLQINKGQTWASVLSKEQNDFLMQLKQSNYYKNFASPAKSAVSDISCEESVIRQEKEKAEQNMFDLIESKVSHESFNLENSFFNRFLRKNKLECSGESTPLIMQKCLANNPNLLHIPSHLNHERSINQHTEICNSEYTECTSDVCSLVSSCCSCRTIEPLDDTSKIKEINKQKGQLNIPNKKEVEQISNEKYQDISSTDTDIMKANMAEMNAKLIATSELLKDRLQELEDEIETFRKENANLTKLREEIDLEKQKFYEEKTTFEQKFNEEKILSEYYLAEEKEKLNKQKQMYERYIREMRGKLNKKDKDEVQNLKKEIQDLKEEIRVKDAKSSSMIARLRNQIKITEKENKDLQAQVEKLKKENRRIQHSNEVTRRLTNIKYLEQINKKLSHMTSKTTQSEVDVDRNMKYKSFEIERQNKSRKPIANTHIRPRAKSVPNLNVTSRYAKYFSQRDVVSQIDKNNSNLEHIDYHSDNEDVEYTCNNPVPLDDSDSITDKQHSESEDENNLEKLYMERFQTISPKSNRSSSVNSRSDSDTGDRHRLNGHIDQFFICKSGSVRDQKISQHSESVVHNSQSSNSSKTNRSKSPIVNTSNLNSQRPLKPVNKTSHEGVEYLSIPSGFNDNFHNRSNSPASFSNLSSSLRSATVISTNHCRKDEKIRISPEPTISRTSVTKTHLNPMEIKKPDGSRELRFPNGNIKYISPDGYYSKFVYYNGDIKENFYKEGTVKYFYAETKTFHTTHADGLEVLEFPDGQVEKRYKDGSSEIRLPNGSIRYFDPKNEHVREEWRFPDGTAMTIAANDERRIVFSSGQVEVHAKDHKRREFPDGTVKLVYNDGTSETRYTSGRVRIKDKHGNLIMDSAPG
ncbi:centromere protein J [Galleria mellonella]|uniref:Centromere protein J n=1 Tax=Galleria mellonella TaxID=7137 RepID=A0A6J1WJY1_GALME|nr:centromere protein J [Galleria mellonella]